MSFPRRSALPLAALALFFSCLPSLVSAFTPMARRQEVHGEAMVSDATVDCTTDQSSTVWMCVSTILVLGMSPALALFEAGMLRSKSTVSLITQIFSGVIVLSVQWVCIGYTLTYGGQGPFLGNLNHAFYIDVSYTRCSVYSINIPEALFATFQMMFAVITPLLMTGAFAERMKFKGYIAFICLWELVIYYPLAHFIWGGGFLGSWGVLDFAGGIVIHTSAGIGSLVVALFLGRRKHFFDFMGEFPPSNLPLAATGAALLWIGWFGFNGGSALQSGPLAVSAISSTQIGCSCGAFMWLVLSWWKEKPQSVALMNGALAGLAGITPASGYINTAASILMGCIFGIASFFSVGLMKHKLHIDDALDVSSVHGLTGVLGSLSIGLFAQTAIDIKAANGWFYGHGMQMVYQLVGVLFTIVYAGVLTWVLLKVVDRAVGGLRVPEEEEDIGIDWSEHHEIAYHKLHVLEDASLMNEAEAPTHHVQSASMNGEQDGLSSSLLSSVSASDDVALSSTHYGTVRDSAVPSSTSVRRTPEVPLPTNYQYKRASGHTPEPSQVR